MSETVFAPSLNLLSALLKKMQIDPQVCIENTLDRPIDQKLLQDPKARVSYRDTEKIWLALEQAAGDQCPAIRVTELIHPSYLGALGYAWLASSSLRTAFNPQRGDLPECFVVFSPGPGQPPSDGVSAAAKAWVRFSEPIDPASVDPFETFSITAAVAPSNSPVRSDAARP